VSTAAAHRLDELRAEAGGCTRCDLYRAATQTVFGAGAPGADVMLVGEQPGDREDEEGEPFVGPAGRVLDAALEASGLASRRLYVTNAVKHFKFEQRGKRRLHQKPNLTEVAACHVWLEAELDVVAPRVVVALGATAARALVGRTVRIGSVRGMAVPWERDAPLVITVHPSSILRAGDGRERAAAREAFVEDLRAAAALLP